MRGARVAMSVKVAINGYGTIGKRVADAVKLQDDMEIVGVTKTRPTFEAGDAERLGFPLFASTQEKVAGFTDAGYDVQGTLEDLLGACDVVVDCTPGKLKAGGTTGALYKPVYERHKVKAIFQGGEKAGIADVSFSAVANYDEALDKDFVRVVSCNTTGLCRTLYPVHKAIGIENVMATMIRRAADPRDSKKGPINAITPVLKVPSHHGPDVQSVMPYIPIQTMAVAVPTTIMHLHANVVNLKREADISEVLGLWKEAPRVKFVSGAKGITSTAQIMEMARDMGRKRADLFEIAVWEDGAHVVGKTLYYYQAIHQESDVVPENIDAIRAMFGIESDGARSIVKTDKALGIG